MKTFLAPLKPTEEKECLIRMRSGDVEASEELILHNMRLVAHVAKKYLNAEEEQEDLISIGTIGLIKAVRTFDWNYGSRFATYAVRCIENEMLMYLRSRKKVRSEVSLYEPIGTDKEGNQIQLFDIMENDNRDILEDLETRQFIDTLKQKLERTLEPREYWIIQKRYGLQNERELTQREIAKELGISRSYVSRIEKKALDKLKRVLLE